MARRFDGNAIGDIIREVFPSTIVAITWSNVEYGEYNAPALYVYRTINNALEDIYKDYFYDLKRVQIVPTNNVRNEYDDILIKFYPNNIVNISWGNLGAYRSYQYLDDNSYRAIKNFIGDIFRTNKY